MATHWGNEGTVRIDTGGGAGPVGEIIEFEFTESVTPVDDTAMGDSYKTHIAGSGIVQWSGTFTAHWDELDAGEVAAAVVGTSMTLALYPEGNSSTDKYYTGTASVIERGITVKMDGETIKQSFGFKGTSTLTLSTA